MATENVELNLLSRWKDLTSDIPQDVQEKWWNMIKSKYSEPVRKYHTLVHLNKMFQHMDLNISDIEIPKALAYAVFFHDIVYDVRSQNNEEESITLFEEFCKESGLNQEIAGQVKELILLSKTHCTDEHKSEEAYGIEDIHYFLDFDISILGSTPDEYKTYASQIREEYKHLSPDTYNFLRTKVLKSFLQIPNIFVTKVFRDTYEEQARKNILEEISVLNKDGSN